MFKQKLDYSVAILEKVVVQSEGMEEETRQLFLQSHIDEVKRLINLVLLEEENINKK